MIYNVNLHIGVEFSGIFCTCDLLAGDIINWLIQF